MNSKTAPPTFPIGVMSDCMGAVHLLRRSGQHSTVAPCVFTAGPCCLDRFCRGDRKKSPYFESDQFDGRGSVALNKTICRSATGLVTCSRSPTRRMTDG